MVAQAPQTSCLTSEHASWSTRSGHVQADPLVSNLSACGPTVFTSAGITHDAKGNLTTNKNGQTYTWDYENLMKTAKNGASTHTYRYDAFRRRVKKELAGGGSVVFAYAGWQVLAEYENGAVPIAPTRTFVYGSYIDEPLMMQSGGHTYYFACNALYSVTALTDSVGNVVERYKYEPYGAVLVLNADGSAKADPVKSEFGNPYTFTGRNLDNETRWVEMVNGVPVQRCGLMFYRNRYYDVDLGRFVGRDPIKYAASKWNLFEYVNSRPVYKMDAIGLGDPDGIGCGGVQIYPPTPFEEPAPVIPHMPSPQRPDWPDPDVDIRDYNCAGFAFRTYERLNREQVRDKLQNCKKINCSEQCNCGQLKCYYWEFDVVVRRLLIMRIGGGQVVRVHPDFHIICGTVPGKDTNTKGPDPSNVCSKNGPRMVVAGTTGAGFKPKPTDVEWPASHFIELKNMTEQCYCCDKDTVARK